MGLVDIKEHSTDLLCDKVGGQRIKIRSPEAKISLVLCLGHIQTGNLMSVNRLPVDLVNENMVKSPFYTDWDTNYIEVTR